jgi:CRP-like cAMP-binding protein
MDSASSSRRNAARSSQQGKELLRKVEFPAGEQLFSQDDPAEALFVIDAGSVQLSKRVHSTTCAIGTLGVGDVFGEAALFGESPYTVTAVALEHTRCLRVLGAQFGEMVRRSPDIAYRFMKKLALRLVHSQFRLSNFALRTPIARLMHQLDAEVGRAGTSDGIPLPFDLPDVLSLERGAVDELIRRLINKGYVSIDGDGNFSIDDLDGFRRYLTYLELRDRFERLESG